MMLSRSVASAGTRRACSSSSSLFSSVATARCHPVVVSSRTHRMASSPYLARSASVSGWSVLSATQPWSKTSAVRSLSGSATTTTSFDFVTGPSSASGARVGRSTPLPLVKIVATIGPTSEQREPLAKVVKAGMTVMRLNFSHATREEVELRCENLKLAQDDLSVGSAVLQNCKSILLDTKGPEIRSGKLANDHSGHETITLPQGHRITLHTDPKVRDEGSTETDLYIDYPSLHKCLKAGSHVLLDDGAVVLVVEKDPDPATFHGTVQCVVQHTGSIRSRAGVNLPLADTSDLPALSDKDKTDIKYGMTMDIDFVAASFVQTAQGVRDIRRYIQECAKELGWDARAPLPKIISKIETAGALAHFDDILAESDGIMVARGDLGVEIPLSQVTCAQKQMVSACNAVGKPVIVATQMVESMTKAPRPTRAEVADVTNAVCDGADAVMTSGETAKGKYPDGTIAFMNEIILNTEAYLKQERRPSVTAYSSSPKSRDSAIARAAVTASIEQNCQAILVLTNQGTLPPLVAAFRPQVPVLVFCESAKLGRQLQLHRAIHPIVSQVASVSYEKMAPHAVDQAIQLGLLQKGDSVVIVSVEGDEHSTADMKIWTA